MRDEQDSVRFLKSAEMRIARAANTIADAIACGDPLDQRRLLDLVTRIVIANNTIASALDAANLGPQADNAADLLWRLGEALHIDTDEQRPAQTEDR